MTFVIGVHNYFCRKKQYQYELRKKTKGNQIYRI